MSDWEDGISKWRADKVKNAFKKKYGRSLGLSRKSSHFSRRHKMSARHSRSKKQRLHSVSPKMQREWAAGVSHWVMQREVARSNYYFLKKFSIIKGNSSEEWKEGIQVWLDQRLLKKSWKWRASKGRFKPSKNRRRIMRLKIVISGENRLRHKTDDPDKRGQTSNVSPNSKAIPIPTVSFTNESEEFKEEEESSHGSEHLEKQMKPRKNSKLFALGICSLVGTIVCLVYGLGYFYSEAVNTIVVTKKNGETGNMSHNSLVYQSDEEKRGSPSNLVSGSTTLPFGSFFLVKEAGGLEMLWVEPGTFTMGSPTTETGRGRNETEHNVTLTMGFYLGKYEVTQAQYEAVMTGNTYGLNAKPSNWRNNPNRPVEKVSWEDVQIFLSRLNFQQSANVPSGWKYVLPTEAQWEYACRAGTNTAYSWGNDINSSRANYNWDGGANDGKDFKQTRDVGQYEPNPWGFFDMQGNVWEWVDWHDSYDSNEVTDPNGSASGSIRVLRGGSWSRDGMYLRSAERNLGTSNRRVSNLGFRVCFQKQ